MTRDTRALPTAPAPDTLDRRALEALRVSESRYRRLFESARDGILILDADTAQIDDVNPYLIELLGYSRAEFLGKKLWDVGAFSDISKSKEMFADLQTTGFVRYEWLPLRTKRGIHIDVEFVSNSYDCEGTKVIQCNIRDITERRRVNEAMQAAKLEAERANAAKSHFLAAASHDLRQPFQALRLFIDMLVETLEKPRNMKLAQMASTALAAGECLLHALLDLSRLDAGVVEVQHRRVTFSEIAGPLVGQYAELARAKGLELTVVGSSAIIDTDPVLLSHLLRNLLDNAIKFTDRGRILLGCRRVGDGVRIEVWDTGIGIAADQKQRIFDAFYQVGNGHRDVNKGLGLGLAVVRGTAQLLGYRFWVRSWPERGSVFAVTIGPLAVQQQDGTLIA